MKFILIHLTILLFSTSLLARTDSKVVADDSEPNMERIGLEKQPSVIKTALGVLGEVYSDKEKYSLQNDSDPALFIRTAETEETKSSESSNQKTSD